MCHSRQLRPSILKRLHASHCGVEATLRCARETVYWPCINAEITYFISGCDACQTFASRQQKETMLPHEIPSRTWEKIGADLFVFDKRDYLILVDYLTNYWEVDFLQGDTSASQVIRKMKAHFARHGIPSLVFSDNGPQFMATQFAEFAQSWGFDHLTSSREYAQANGKAEAAVKSAKNIMQKAAYTNTDGWLAILEYRNTPTQF